MTKPSFRVVIPARYASSRLPGKPLLPLAGRPLVLRVWDVGVKSRASEVLVATGELLEEAARREAEAVFRTLKWAAALLHAAPGPDDVDALGGAFVRLLGEFRRFTLGGAAPPGALPAATASRIGGRA